MNELEYNKQLITDYLLGSLSDEKAERFDELSFIDEDFSQLLNSVENDLIDAYTHNELDGATLQKFKTYYLSSPLRREKVNFAESLQDYAKRNISQKNSESANPVESESKKKQGFFSSLNIFANFSLQRAAAAAVLIFILLSGFWLINRNVNQPENEIAQNRESKNLPNENSPKGIDNSIPSAVNNSEAVNTNGSNVSNNPQLANQKSIPGKIPPVKPVRTPEPQSTFPPTVIAAFTLAPPLRGTNQLQSVSFSNQTTAVKMNLKLDGDDYKTYQVKLTDDSQKSLWQRGTVKSRNGALTVIFPAKHVKSPRIYSLIVSGINSEGEPEIISNYSFRVVQ